MDVDEPYKENCPHRRAHEHKSDIIGYQKVWIRDYSAPCRCKLPENVRDRALITPANAPFLNPSELGFNRLMQHAADLVEEGLAEYGPTLDAMKNCVRLAMKRFKEDKEWFVTTWKNIPSRWWACVQAGGHPPQDAPCVEHGSRIWATYHNRVDEVLYDCDSDSSTDPSDLDSEVDSDSDSDDDTDGDCSGHPADSDSLDGDVQSDSDCSGHSSDSDCPHG